MLPLPGVAYMWRNNQSMPHEEGMWKGAAFLSWVHFLKRVYQSNF